MGTKKSPSHLRDGQFASTIERRGKSSGLALGRAFPRDLMEHRSASMELVATQSSFTRKSSTISAPSETSRSIAEARPIHK